MAGAALRGFGAILKKAKTKPKIKKQLKVFKAASKAKGIRGPDAGPKQPMRYMGTKASYRASMGLDTPSGRKKASEAKFFIQGKKESTSAFNKRVEKTKKAAKEHIEKDKKRKEKRAMRQAGLKE